MVCIFVYSRCCKSVVDTTQECRNAPGTIAHLAFVLLQHVDEENSYLCGYLKIKGLTEEFPTLTTFFDGEIISKKYPFLTRKWDADEDVDKKHWVRTYTYHSSYHRPLISGILSVSVLFVLTCRVNLHRSANTLKRSIPIRLITRR